MANVQKVAPNTNAQDGAGWCLRFTQTVFRNVQHAYLNSAWDAWASAQHPRTGRPPTDVVVPIYFEHWGTYGNPPTYKNWGHIAAHFPNGAVLSSPASGYGQQWFSSIEEMARAIPSKYVGWSYDLVGGMVADVAPAPPEPEQPKRKKQHNMIVLYNKNALPNGKEGWALTGPGYWAVIESRENARNILKQLGIEFPLEVGAAGWTKFKEAAGVK